MIHCILIICLIIPNKRKICFIKRSVSNWLIRDDLYLFIDKVPRSPSLSSSMTLREYIELREYVNIVNKWWRRH